MNGAKLLDTLRGRFQIKSDAALARELEIGAPDVCKVRGGAPLTPRVILSIHKHLGVSVKEIRELAA